MRIPSLKISSFSFLSTLHITVFFSPDSLHNQCFKTVEKTHASCRLTCRAEKINQPFETEKVYRETPELSNSPVLTVRHGQRVCLFIKKLRLHGNVYTFFPPLPPTLATSWAELERKAQPKSSFMAPPNVVYFCALITTPRLPDNFSKEPFHPLNPCRYLTSIPLFYCQCMPKASQVMFQAAS